MRHAIFFCRRESVRYVDVEITRHGFGYDSTSDDYKVIRQVMYAPKSDIDSESHNDDDVGFDCQVS
uniref:Uncharacterized protein n=1 Tax=Medicago truncatula TaxID=3880 RepID=A2Q608_MEDTR|nr:hypothetical protein MtrDRAFT_AC172742g9v1 [Medicago truncatula]